MSLTAAAPVLTAQDHEHFLEHGYVVVKRAVPPETIAAAVEALEAGAYTGRVGDADYRPVRAEAVAECVTDTVHAAIAEIFGEAYPFDRSRHGDDMPRPYRPEADWPPPRAHIDDDYPTLMPNGWALGLFIFLTPVRPHGGAFVLFPGSYRRYQEALAASPDGILGVVAAPELAGEHQEFLAEPGDILLFHHLMGHAGSENVADPQTRHALLSRWHPHARIVPGDKSLTAMTTIEKANSLRHQHERFGTTFQTPDDGRGQGLARPGNLTAQTLLPVQGETHLLCVDDTQPHVIQHARSTDLSHWEFGEPLPTFSHPVDSLSLFQRGSDVLLLVGTAGAIRIYRSRGLTDWAPLHTVPEAEFGVGHYSTSFGSRTARGQVLFFVSPEQPTQVRCRWAKAWDQIGEAAGDEAVVAEAPDGRRITGLCLKPVFSESGFALVADLAEPEGAGTRPFYTLSGDSASYPDPLRPLAFTAPTAPRALQVYRRARNYWIVTYLRDQDGQARLFWGVIDWQHEPATLREITTPEQWATALEIVGVL
ncbi:MAG: phytanoyl-CoA dioxygenase family protein [Armatimonadetes bacterium]|nr:phytanoyl-CoA dioxygenase family protein [Armatimonadota bacterium]